LRKGTRKSNTLFQEALRFLVGGVNSPVRSFKGINRENPLFIKRAKGSKIYDEDGNEFIDYVCSWGASILGSAYPSVVKKVQAAVPKGLSYGAATEQETELAEKINQNFSSMELMRLVSSGTEATMSAIRVARAYTKKDKVLKFDGCYHGHSDAFLVRGGSGLATFSVADSAGVPQTVASETVVARYNDLASVEALMQQKGVAAIIVEPVAGNMGVVPPSPGFLQGLREICDKHDSVLIFDEVITGFRVSQKGAQGLYKVTPDMTCLGKIIGGGMNIAAYGGKKEIMQLVSPLGPVYQAGTLAGNPVAVASGIATLNALRPSVYSNLEAKSKRLAQGLNEAAKGSAEIKINRIGSMIGLFFTNKPVNNYDDVKKCSMEKYASFFNRMLENGVYLPPSAFETIFVSAAHSAFDISKTIKSASNSFLTLT
jgi:glutamate-1-semialdehyde 2,1-aminomutase